MKNASVYRDQNIKVYSFDFSVLVHHSDKFSTQAF